MYTKENSYIVTSDTEPLNYIETKSVSGSDIMDLSNSELLYNLDHYTDKLEYTITRFEYRIDLISKDIYGDDSYSGLLLYMNRMATNDLYLRNKLYYIPKDKLTALMLRS